MPYSDFYEMDYTLDRYGIRRYHPPLPPTICSKKGPETDGQNAGQAQSDSPYSDPNLHIQCIQDMQCKQCNKVFIYQKRFFSHVKRGCAGRRTYPCEKCGYNFTRTNDLKKHVENDYQHCKNTKIKIHNMTKCDYCDKNVKMLDRHLLHKCLEFRKVITSYVTNHGKNILHMLIQKCRKHDLYMPLCCETALTLHHFFSK